MPKDIKPPYDDISSYGPHTKGLYFWYEEPLDDAAHERLQGILDKNRLKKGAYGIAHDFDEYHSNRSSAPSTNNTQSTEHKENMAYWLKCSLTKKQAQHAKELKNLKALQAQRRKRGDGTTTSKQMNDLLDKDVKRCKKTLSEIELYIQELKKKITFHGVDRS